MQVQTCLDRPLSPLIKACLVTDQGAGAAQFIAHRIAIIYMQRYVPPSRRGQSGGGEAAAEQRGLDGASSHEPSQVGICRQSGVRIPAASQPAPPPLLPPLQHGLLPF